MTVPDRAQARTRVPRRVTFVTSSGHPKQLSTEGFPPARIRAGTYSGVPGTSVAVIAPP